jgi:hypothetical protein
MKAPFDQSSPTAATVAPPIPSPFPDETAATRAPKASYAVPILIGLGITGVMVSVRAVLGMDSIAAVVLPLYSVAAIYGTLRIKHQGERLGHVLRTHEDVASIKPVVDLNMKLAYSVMVTLWPFFLLAILSNKLVYSVAVMAISIPFGMWSAGIESKFKAMPVESTDPSVKAAFDQILVWWKEPRFGLPK